MPPTSDVVVIGAGPGGLAAAAAVADSGATVTVVDEYASTGGQFYKKAGSSFRVEASRLSREHAAGERLRRTLQHENVRVLTGALVWGCFEDVVMVFHEGRSEALRPRALVIASGAYDRPVAFPGWTLPGVMSAGGAQTLAKTQWIKPGERMLLAGAGPFLLPVAQQLLRSGVTIVGILEATGPRDWLPHAPALWGQWPRFGEAWSYLRSLRQAGVRTSYRTRIVRAEGADRVEAAVIADVDAEWRTVPGTERTLAVDAIATGYGFLPNIEAAASRGCDLRWDPFAQTWFVACDYTTMATNQPGVFVAGEVTGIGGSALAQAEGELAGVSAAEHVGAISAGEARRRREAPGKRRAHLARFADMLNRLFRPRPGLWEGLDGDTIVCRCEEVTAGNIDSSIAEGCTSPKAVKDWTRAGMGLCQGRMCRAMVSELIARRQGLDPGRIPFPHLRPPIKPVPLDALTAAGETLT